MVYEKTDWKDRVISNPLTYTVSAPIVANTPFTLIPNEGTITETGTPLNSANLNKLETQYDEAKVLIDEIDIRVDTAETNIADHEGRISANTTAIGNKFDKTGGTITGNLVATGTITEKAPVWTAITLLNGATANNARTPMWCRKNGVVYLRGEVSNLIGVIGTTPNKPDSSYALNTSCPMATGGVAADALVSINTNGDIQVIRVGNTTSGIALNTISFVAI